MLDNWAASATQPQTGGFSASRATQPERLDTSGFQNTNTNMGGFQAGLNQYMQPWNQKPGWEANTPVNQAHLAAFNARPAHQWGFGATPRTPQRPPTPAELAAGKAWAPQLKDFVIPGLGSMNPPQGPQAPGPLAMKTPYGLPSMVPRGAATVPGEAPMGGMKAPYAMPYMVPRGYQADPYEQMQQDVSAAMGAAKKAPYTPTALRGNNYAQSPQGYVVSDPEPRPAARPRLSSPSTRY